MGIYETMKDVVALVQKLDNIDLTNKILDLQQGVLAEREETAALQRSVDELQRRLDVSGRLVFDRGLYWLTSADENRDGPFCTRCWDVEHLLVRVWVQGQWCRCPNCENEMTDF